MSGIVANATAIFSGFVINSTMILVVKNTCGDLVEPTVISRFCVHDI
jgi:hypothetical protein